MRLGPLEKREIAEKFLAWLERKEIKSWPNTYLLLLEASEAINEEVYTLWKAVDLLLALGRIVRVSPNGRKGCRVVSFTALTKPVPSNAIICCRANCPILKRIGEILK